MAHGWLAPLLTSRFSSQFLQPAPIHSHTTHTIVQPASHITLDSGIGIISGSVNAAGTYKVRITVRGPRGTAEAGGAALAARRTLTIVAGQDKLAMTPPMGWNSWNVWAGAVSADKVKAAADA